MNASYKAKPLYGSLAGNLQTRNSAGSQWVYEPKEYSESEVGKNAGQNLLHQTALR